MLKEAYASVQNGFDQSVNLLSQTDCTDSVRFDSHQITQLIEHHNIKIGRELHDDLCPDLTCMEMALQSIQNQPEMNEVDRGEKLDALLRMVKSTLLKARTITTGLNLSIVEELGLSKAVSNWVALMDSAIPMKLVFTGATRNFTLLQPIAGVHIFRIAQESIQNAIKHSGASLIEVRLEVQGRDLLLAVQDNGNGIVKDGQFAVSGFGISNMRYRSQWLQARLSFCENAPQGVKVRCEIPSIIGTQ